MSPGQEMGLFSRMVPGDRRCNVLRHYFTREGHTWPGSAEMSFLRHITEETLQSMKETGEVTIRGRNTNAMGWSTLNGTPAVTVLGTETRLMLLTTWTVTLTTEAFP